MSTQAPDLNAPGLSRQLCAPITAGLDDQVTFDRSVVIITSGPFTVLRHCGSTRVVRLGRYVHLLQARPSLVAWEATTGVIEGLNPSSDRTFQIAAPGGSAPIMGLILTSHHLYVSNPGATWQGTWPQPRAIKRHST